MSYCFTIHNEKFFWTYCKQYNQILLFDYIISIQTVFYMLLPTILQGTRRSIFFSPPAFYKIFFYPIKITGGHSGGFFFTKLFFVLNPYFRIYQNTGDFPLFKKNRVWKKTCFRNFFFVPAKKSKSPVLPPKNQRFLSKTRKWFPRKFWIPPENHPRIPRFSTILFWMIFLDDWKMKNL